MTSETHPTAVQMAHHMEVINGLFECDCGQPFHSTTMALAHLNNAVDQAIRERDEAIALLRRVVGGAPSSTEMRLLAVRIAGSDRRVIDEFMPRWEWLQDTSDEARAFLSNYPQEDGR